MKSFNFNIFYVLNQLRSLWFLKNLFEIKYHYFLINHNFQTVLVFFKVWIFRLMRVRIMNNLYRTNTNIQTWWKYRIIVVLKMVFQCCFLSFIRFQATGFKQQVCWFTYHELYEPFLLLVGNDIVKPAEFSLSKNIRKIIHCFSNSNYGCYHQRETNWNVMIRFYEP